MATKAELKALITLAGKIDPSLSSALMKAQGETAKLSSKFSQLGTITKGVFAGNLLSKAVSSAWSYLRTTGSEAIELASSLQEVQNVVDVTFGSDSARISEWASTAKAAFGLSELQAKRYNGTLGSMMESSGVSSKYIADMSTKLAGLSGDMASFHNLNPDRAFEKLRSGISGETEPLKELGINMSVANLQAYALSKGINQSWSQMDQATQTMLRYGYIMKASEKYQGDFVRTQGSFANQSRLLKVNWQELMAKLYTNPLPELGKSFQKLNDIVSKIDVGKLSNDIAYGFKLLAGSIEWVTQNSGWLLPVLIGVGGAIAAFNVISPIIGLFIAWRKVSETMTLVQWALNSAMFANPAVALAVAFGALLAVGVAIWRNWERFVNTVKKFFGIKVSDQNTELTDAALKIQPLQKYAGGGIATRASIFGEAGPEMAIPLRRSSRSLALLDQTTQLLGGGSGGGAPAIIQYMYFGSGDPGTVKKAARDGAEDAIERYQLNKARLGYGH